MRKALPTLAFVAVVALAVWAYLAPFRALRHMVDAARAGDSAELATYVDFPSVRESLKGALNGKVTSAASTTGNALVLFGAAFAGALVNPVVDALVTPESLALLLSGVKPQADGTTTVPLPADDDVETTAHYESVNSFVVTVKRKGSSSDPVGLKLGRDGLLSFKLSSVTF